MGDILSQKEIDDLLKALSTGEIDAKQIQNGKEEKRVKVHDFRRSSKFSKDHIRTLRFMHENYARLISTFLTGYLRSAVQIDVVEVESLPYSDFNNSIPTPVILAVIDFNPLNGSLIMEMEPAVAFAFIDKVLGGRGALIEKIRNFSEIEIAIIERIIIQMLNLMPEPWENVATIRPLFQRIETNAQFAQIISQNEAVAIVTLSVKVGEVEGFINLCLPYIVLEPIIPKLSTRLWFSMKEKEIASNAKNTIQERIEYTKVPVSAILGKATVNVSDILTLQVGDVVQLDTAIDTDIEVMVGNNLKFYAKPGVRKNKTSIKVTRVLREED